MVRASAGYYYLGSETERIPDTDQTVEDAPLLPTNDIDRFCHDVVHMIHVTKKPVFGVSNQVRHKPACSASEASQSLEIVNIASIGIILSWK